ncbi:MAG: helix-turn-helix domain-containing protein [Rhodobacteraceae bacterium]|nr:helix-turn-helix domain-containing protein [Paracoccaceae bacterium]
MKTGRLNIETEAIRSAFTTTEYTLRGKRSYLAILYAGACQLVDDDIVRKIEAPALIWTPVGTKARLSIAPASRGILLRVPETILGLSVPEGSITGHVRQAIHHVIVLPSIDAALIKRMRALFEEIEAELGQNDPAAQVVVHHCLSLMLIHLWRASNPTAHGTVLLPRQIVHEFLGLVELHMQSHWTVERYARHLGISKDRLNTAMRRSASISPNQYIQKRLIDEIKTLLLNSDLNVAEIAFKLGFSDAAYFSRFFQRHENLPPGRFRTQNAGHLEREKRARAFAAWP